MQLVKATLILSALVILAASVMAVPVATHSDNSSAALIPQNGSNLPDHSITALSAHSMTGRVAGGPTIERYRYDSDSYLGNDSRFRYGSSASINVLPGLDPTPVPEPTTMLLFAMGLAGAGAVRRFRQRSP